MTSATENDPDQIRQQIEITRSQLSQDVNALAENARPSTMVRRRVSRVRGSFGNVRHRLMGSPDRTPGYHGPGYSPGYASGYTGPGYSAAGSYSAPTGADEHSLRDSAQSAMGSVSDTAHSAVGSVTETAQQAPTMVRERTEGNPLAVGLIAFGVGWLAGSLVPASEAEQHAAERVKEQAQPLVEKAGEIAKDAAGELKENLQEPAQQAAQSVRDSATDAASTVKDEAGTAARETRQAQQSGQARST